MSIKKILSLSLAAGLAVGSSSNVFAWNGQLGSDVSFSTTEEIMSSASELFKTRACVVVLLKVLCHNVMSSAVQDFCKHLELLKHLKEDEYVRKAEEIEMEFKQLYTNDLAFKQAVDDAWIWNDTTGGKQHASIQGGVRNLSRSKTRRCPGRSIDG